MARLLRQAARQRKLAVQVCEWPGEEPLSRVRALRVPPDVLRSIANGATAVPLGRKRLPPHFAGIPWGTLVLLEAGGEVYPVAVGPAIYRRSQWVLPRFYHPDVEPADDLRTLRKQIARLRREYRLNLSPQLT